MIKIGENNKERKGLRQLKFSVEDRLYDLLKSHAGVAGEPLAVYLRRILQVSHSAATLNRLIKSKFEKNLDIKGCENKSAINELP